jgi:hypothetical protein
MLEPARALAIRKHATELLQLGWSRRSEILADPTDPLSFLRDGLRPMVQALLQVQLEEPTHLCVEDIQRLGAPPNYRLAGFLDREARRIVVARDSKEEIRRFTIAHEVGHFILHPFTLLHRDLPVSGAERRNYQRPRIECEADLFGAELLMPEKPVRAVYEHCYGDPIDENLPEGDVMSFCLPTGRHVSPKDFRLNGADFRAMVVASAIGFRHRHFASPSKTFRSTVTAMAIQLQSFGWVK